MYQEPVKILSYVVNCNKRVGTGNSNLVYTIIRKRAVFHNLANLPHEHAAIARSLATARAKGHAPARSALPRSVPASRRAVDTLFKLVAYKTLYMNL